MLGSGKKAMPRRKSLTTKDQAVKQGFWKRDFW